MAEKTKKIRKSKEGLYLALPPLMLERLRQEKEKCAYDSIQEVIKETIRKRYFLTESEAGIHRMYTGAKRGPKPKFNHEKMISGESVLYWDKGEKKEKK